MKKQSLKKSILILTATFLVLPWILALMTKYVALPFILMF